MLEKYPLGGGQLAVTHRCRPWDRCYIQLASSGQARSRRRDRIPKRANARCQEFGESYGIHKCSGRGLGARDAVLLVDDLYCHVNCLDRRSRLWNIDRLVGLLAAFLYCLCGCNNWTHEHTPPNRENDGNMGKYLGLVVSILGKRNVPKGNVALPNGDWGCGRVRAT